MTKVHILYLIIISFASHVSASDLIGKWTSNKELTLESARQFESEMSEEVRELFFGDLFGHLIAEYKENVGRSYFESPEDNVEEMYEFKPYKLVEETLDYFIIQYFDELTKKNVVKKLYREGECYYGLTSKWNIKEYFCRVTNKP